MPRQHRLVTLAFSHYNEKARWALDWCGVPYREERYMPGFSQLAVLAATKGRGGRADRISSKLSTPVLITNDGRALCDSTDIARWASATLASAGDGPLFPEPEVRTLVEHFGDELGPYTRLVAYYHVTRSPAAMRALSANVGAVQALAFRALVPIGRRALMRSLGVTPARAMRANERVLTQLDAVEARIAGHGYLVGDRFTAADLTFASLLAPLLLVTPNEGYGATFPRIAQLPEDAQSLVGELRARPAGQFALDMYRRHRRRGTSSPSTTKTSGAAPPGVAPESQPQPPPE